MTSVSLLMTAYNPGRYAKEAIQSVLAQDCDDWELILIDNGSTDGSVDFADQHDARIKLFRFDKNIGRTPALQFALQRSSFPYIAILDADDIASPDRFRLQARFLDEHPTIVLVGSAVNILDSESKIRGRLCLHQGHVSHDVLAERNVFVHSSVMFRRLTAVALGGYDPSYKFAQDYHLILRLATQGRCHILPHTLSGLRVTPASMSNSKESQLVRAADEAKLFAFAATELTLTPYGKRQNRKRQAISMIYFGLVRIKFKQPLAGLIAIAAGLTRDKTFSWIVYLVRRYRGRFQ